MLERSSTSTTRQQRLHCPLPVVARHPKRRAHVALGEAHLEEGDHRRVRFTLSARLTSLGSLGLDERGEQAAASSAASPPRERKRAGAALAARHAPPRGVSEPNRRAQPRTAPPSGAPPAARQGR
eukprot:CAMPEP_0202796378 /NCGR_PEP_ID=MMETSP1388-20130828/91993_1 /ASSEMBLY_ACC=CAM_ASM_000864 /TAXON_ID=37098 /ORGANISM="Isochrysis sp, Strain CCMP1244" /LENGTH=124 /DNA_ID=CAMNT_0049466273 /DNA_START=70 /DNA_END=440 /DNA_ORIENTATION=+